MKKSNKNDKDSKDKNQLTISSFFSLTKDRQGSSPKNQYIEDKLLSLNFESKKSTKNNVHQQEKISIIKEEIRKLDIKPEGKLSDGYESTKTVELDDVDQIFDKKKEPIIEGFDDNSKTYCLPCHIPKVWKVAKPLLDQMRLRKINNLNSFLEAIIDIMESHFVTRPSTLNIENLRIFMESLSGEELTFFFDSLLPFMATLALHVENWFKTTPLVILAQNTNTFVHLEKKQVACLLTHMFFCTLHLQNNSQLPTEFSFYLLYKNERCNETKLEKIRCFYHYFRRIHKKIPDTNITYQRLCLSLKTHGRLDLDYWTSSKATMKSVLIKDDGSIEKTKKAIQVDFANTSLGGGVLNSGCVQEEIRFTICPELLVSMLFTEKLLDHEAVIIFGTEQFCEYDGYDNSFKFVGDCKEETKVDDFMHKETCLLAIDALNFAKATNPNSQYKLDKILRELNKAYIGFYGSDKESGERKPIATGRWGCGVFKGDAQFKFILQWIAASQANRKMIFYRFDDKRLTRCDKIVRKFSDKTVGEMFKLLINYQDVLFKQQVEMELFDFMLDVYE